MPRKSKIDREGTGGWGGTRQKKPKPQSKPKHQNPEVIFF